jgi:copper(I)-binding protein
MLIGLCFLFVFGLLKPSSDQAWAQTSAQTSAQTLGQAAALRTAEANEEPLSGGLELQAGSYVRAPLPGQSMTSAYLSLYNSLAQAVELVSVRSDASSEAEFHESQLGQGMSRMRARTSLLLAAGETLHMEPGGLHIMLFGLEESRLEEGQVSIRVQALISQTQVAQNHETEKQAIENRTVQFEWVLPVRSILHEGGGHSHH